MDLLLFVDLGKRTEVGIKNPSQRGFRLPDSARWIWREPWWALFLPGSEKPFHERSFLRVRGSCRQEKPGVRATRRHKTQFPGLEPRRWLCAPEPQSPCRSFRRTGRCAGCEK